MTRRRKILGIYPTLDGALAIYNDVDSMSFHVMPVTGTGQDKKVDWPELARIIDAAPFIDHAFIEDTVPHTDQGAATLFELGYLAGELRGVTAANFIPSTVVTPRTWRDALNVPPGRAAARTRASEQFLTHAWCWQNPANHSRAEAALIAYHGFQKYDARRGSSRSYATH